MRRSSPLATLVACVLATAVAACEYPPVSLHPLHTEADLVDVPEIVGQWTDEADLVVTFDTIRPGVYTMELQSVESPGAMHSIGYTLELSGRRFLNLDPALEFWDELVTDVPSPMIPVHLWFGLEMRPDTVVLETMERDEWISFLEARGTDHYLFDDDGGTEYLLLPQGTAELQEIVVEAFDDETLERDTLILVRERIQG